MLTSLLALLLGIATGTITGITPGLHINLVAAIITGSTAALTAVFQPLDIGIYLLAMSITHTFVDAIPTVFLGVAEGGELLSLQPSQRLVLEGKGMHAILLLTAGALGGLLLSISLVPATTRLLPPLYTYLKPHIPLILTILLIWMVLRDRDADTRFWSVFLVATSGLLGLIVLRTLNLDDPLLPMLSGLYGISTLTHSFLKKTQLPPQEHRAHVALRGSSTATAIASSTIGGSIISLLPGLGPAQAAVMARTVLPALDENAFLLLTGGINTVNMALSLVTMSTLGFARNGAMDVMLDIVKRPDPLSLTIFCALALIAGGLATIITLLLARRVAGILERTNYSTVSATIITCVAALVLWRSGPLGILVLLVATAIGLIAILRDAPRHHLMACILIPVIWATA